MARCGISAKQCPPMPPCCLANASTADSWASNPKPLSPCRTVLTRRWGNLGLSTSSHDQPRNCPEVASWFKLPSLAFVIRPSGDRPIRQCQLQCAVSKTAFSARRPHGRERIYVVPQDDLKLLVRFYAASQGGRAGKHPLSWRHLGDALQMLGVKVSEFVPFPQPAQ